MMKKILVIFFLALISLGFIYKSVKKEDYLYLSLGDAIALGHTPFETYSKSYVDYYYDYLKKKNPKIKINKDFLNEDIRIKDLTNQIRNTTKASNNLPQLIKKANVITLSIGSEELFSKLRSTYNLKILNNRINFEYVDTMFIDLENLIKEIKKINKCDLYLIGYYNPLKIDENNETYINSLFNYLDIKFKTLEKETKIKYVKIDKGFKEKDYYLPSLNNAFPSLEGYNYIANQIIAFDD